MISTSLTSSSFNPVLFISWIGLTLISNACFKSINKVPISSFALRKIFNSKDSIHKKSIEIPDCAAIKPFDLLKKILVKTISKNYEE